MPLRTPIQLALAAVGLACFALAIRNDDDHLLWIAIACFAIATLLRFFKRSESNDG